MGFKPSKADPDIWMKSSKDGSHYEYIAVYVDDLAICMKDPKSFCDTLKEKYKLKLEGVGPINYHLGCGYARDKDGTLVADPRKYVEKILESYEKNLEKTKEDHGILGGRRSPMLKIPVLYSCRSPALRESSTLLGSPVIFS